MKKIIEIDISPSKITNEAEIKHLVSCKANIPKAEISGIKLLRRSIDARKRNILFHLTVEAYINELPQDTPPYIFTYSDVSKKPPVIIVGTGPAGLCAALRCIELGIKPILIERGKTVEERKYDIAVINRKRIINPNSNYCFGEGGAGTYSDGKLYTRSTKRGDVNRILHILYNHGASPDILIDTHAHIGTDKLPAIISNIRATILNHGGEIHFNQQLTDIIIKNGIASGIITNEGNTIEGHAVILATGHSARDIYMLLHRKNITLEAKPFAVGVRIEHPQALINSIQYHTKTHNPFLPTATYSLVCQSDNKGVFSFCMCPGGTIVTASTSQEELVLNGMSNSKRNLTYANSGLVVSVNENDFPELKQHGALAGLFFQEDIEKKAFLAGGANLTAPAQRMNDFVQNKFSASLNNTSYYPGIKSVQLNEVLPSFITKRMQEAFTVFDRKMKGYLTNEATLLGVETRTSSPIRIPRDPNNLEQLQIENLYPCGEGAGYAGGITSSAIDGERCAEAVAKKIL